MSKQAAGNLAIEALPDHLVSRTAIRVRFSETDAMGIVHHARFFDYCEVAREEYIRRRGVEFSEIYRTGLNLPLSEAHLRFERPVRFGAILLVEIRLTHLTRARLRFEYRFLDPSNSTSDERPHASGCTEHVLTDAGLRLQRLPRALIARLLGPEQDPKCAIATRQGCEE